MKHKQLQCAVVNQFAPRFAPGAKVLYLKGTQRKPIIKDVDGLKQMGFPAGKHRLPDVVLHLPKKNWLFLIEAATLHGPISPLRYRELEAMLARSSAWRVYVSVFPDFESYGRYGDRIAWKTAVWIAEEPNHTIHYDSDKIIGPRKSPRWKARQSELRARL